MTKRMWLPATLDQATHQRLENWGDVFGARSPGRISKVRNADGVMERVERHSLTSGGIETQYRAPGEQVMRVVNPWAADVDAEDAGLVNRVIMHPEFPAWHRRFLVGHYRDGAKPEKLHRELGIRWREYLRYQAAAVLVAKNRLTALESRLYAPLHNLSSASSRGVPEVRSSEASAPPKQATDGKKTALAA